MSLQIPSKNISNKDIYITDNNIEKLRKNYHINTSYYYEDYKNNTIHKTLKNLGIVAFGGLIISELDHKLTLYYLSNKYPYKKETPISKYIYKKNGVSFDTNTSEKPLCSHPGYYTINNAQFDDLLIGTSEYFDISIWKLINILVENTASELLQIARSIEMFNYSSDYFDIEENETDAVYFSDARDDMTAWVEIMPPNPTVDELAKSINRNFIAIAGIAKYKTYADEKTEYSVYFFSSNNNLTGLENDYSHLTSYIIDPAEKNMFTSLNHPKAKKLTLLREGGFYHIVNVDLKTQIEACAKVMNVSYDIALRKIKAVTNKKIFKKVSKKFQLKNDKEKLEITTIEQNIENESKSKKGSYISDNNGDKQQNFDAITSYGGIYVSMDSTFKNLGIVALGGLIMTEDKNLTLYYLSEKFQYSPETPISKYIYQKENKIKPNSSTQPTHVYPGYYTFSNAKWSDIFGRTIAYFEITPWQFINITIKNTAPELIALARENEMFNYYDEGIVEDDDEAVAPYFMDGRDDSGAWVEIMPPNPTIDELAKSIKRNFIAICGITEYEPNYSRGQKKLSVYFFMKNYGIGEESDWSDLVSYAIKPKESHWYTSSKKKIDPIDYVECGIQYIGNVDLKIQIGACAKVMGVSYDIALQRIKAVTNKKIIEKLEKNFGI